MENLSYQLYHTHISSKHKLMDLKLKEVWRYRDLVLLFTKRSFVLRYKQTILGPAWIFLNPLFSSIIYSVVFSGIAGIGQIVCRLCCSICAGMPCGCSSPSVWSAMQEPLRRMPMCSVRFISHVLPCQFLICCLL